MRRELRRLTALAWPVAMAQAATMLMGLVDLLMVGQLGGQALASVGLANPWIFGTLFFAGGLIFGIDPLVTQAHGAGDNERALHAFRRGLVLALVMSPPVIGLWLISESVLLATGQEPLLAAGAARYIEVQLASVPFFLCNTALRQYLQGREIVRPAMLVVLVANLFNALFNWVLIFGKLGFPALGLEGAGIATAATRILSLIMLVFVVRKNHLLRGVFARWDSSIFERKGFRELLALGVPIALQLSLEMWAFNLSNWIAGRIGSDAIAGHVVVMHMASFSFMFVTGVSQATTVRVGNLIGARRHHDAQRAAWIGVALGSFVMACFALSFMLGRHHIPWIYTKDAVVIAAAVAIVPLAAAFQIFDGIQNVCCGVLRGMGRPLPAAIANFIGYWLIALPLGVWLAFSQEAGLPGLWLGLAIGLVVVATGLLLFITWRGPAGEGNKRESNRHLIKGSGPPPSP